MQNLSSGTLEPVIQFYNPKSLYNPNPFAYSHLVEIKKLL